MNQNISQWYCVRSHPKREALAAEALRQAGLESVFCPRIRFRRATRRGPVWFVEALFPGYLFARFNATESIRLVKTTLGVTGIVQFGGMLATLKEETITLLRTQLSEEAIIDAAPTFQEGDRVSMMEGAFFGLEAVVKSYMPATDRVKVLLEFLGQTLEVDAPALKLKPAKQPRETIVLAGV